MTEFRWNPQREQAAFDVADDHRSDVEIAERAGVSRKTLFEWKKHPEFQERVDSRRREIAEKIARRGIAEKQTRINELDALYRDLKRIKAARAERLAHLIGGDTGLVVAEPVLIKVQGYTDDDGRFRPTGEAELVEVEKVDVGLYRELRATLKDMAEQSAGETEVDDRDLGELTDEELDDLERRLLGKKGRRRA